MHACAGWTTMCMRAHKQRVCMCQVQVAAAEIMQRQYRRARDLQKYIYFKREKGDADKRTQTRAQRVRNDHYLSFGSKRGV